MPIYIYHDTMANVGEVSTKSPYILGDPYPIATETSPQSQVGEY